MNVPPLRLHGERIIFHRVPKRNQVEGLFSDYTIYTYDTFIFTNLYV